MNQEIKKENETIFDKRNYIILLIGTILMIIGYILMSGEGSTLAAYNPDIFSKVRIRIAPIICLSGYLVNAFGVCFRFPSIKHDYNKRKQRNNE